MPEAIVTVTFEVEINTDNWKDYSDIETVATTPEEMAEVMVDFDIRNFPEALESEEPVSVKFKEWI